MARGSRYKRGNNETRIPINRQMWASTHHGTYAYLHVPEEFKHTSDHELFAPESGDNVYIEIPTGAGFTHLINLTKLTVQELDYVGEIFTTAIAAAKPICKKRDQDAKDADPGELPPERAYRQPPVLYERPKGGSGIHVRDDRRLPYEAGNAGPEQ